MVCRVPGCEGVLEFGFTTFLVDISDTVLGVLKNWDLFQRLVCFYQTKPCTCILTVVDVTVCIIASGFWFFFAILGLSMECLHQKCKFKRQPIFLRFKLSMKPRFQTCDT